MRIKDVIKNIQKYKDDKNKIGCVYFFKHNNVSAIKIGKSSHKNPYLRFKSLKTFSPYGCEILGFINTEYYNSLETELHTKYSDFRLQGEWFEISIEEVTKIINIYKGYLYTDIFGNVVTTTNNDHQQKNNDLCFEIIKSYNKKFISKKNKDKILK